MTTWRERIVEARERGKFTHAEVELARGWATCAVGEQRQQYPDLIVYHAEKGSTYVHPADAELEQLGCIAGFFGCVVGQAFDEAEAYLDRIEDRVLQLKREAQP